MFVVGQRVWLEAGRMRRFLLRAMLVVGGACAATILGWLFSAGSANAAELSPIPTLPLVSPALSSVSPEVLTPNALTTVPEEIVDLSTSDVKAIGAQAHDAVNAIGERVTPLAGSASSLLSPVTRVIPSVVTQGSPEPVAATEPADVVSVAQQAPVASATLPTRQLASTVVPLWHTSASHAPLAVPQTASPDEGQCSPVVPPLQPAGSPDSTAHVAGPAGGFGGAQLTFAYLIGDGIALADTPNLPRPIAGPGHQPGASPD